MKFSASLALSFATIFATGAVAQATLPDPFEVAVASGICGDAGVANAYYNEDNTQVLVECEEDVVALFPLAGAAPAVLGGIAGLVLVASATSDTQ